MRTRTPRAFAMDAENARRIISAITHGGTELDKLAEEAYSLLGITAAPRAAVYRVSFEVILDKNGWKASATRPILTGKSPGPAVSSFSIPNTATIEKVEAPLIPGYYRSLVNPQKVRYFELVRPEPGEWEHVEIKVRDNAGL